MDKVTIHVDESLETHMPRCWPARLEVTMPGGKLEKTIIAAPGEPDRRIAAARVQAKFHAVADRLIGKDEADDWGGKSMAALKGEAQIKQLYDKFDGLFA